MLQRLMVFSLTLKKRRGMTWGKWNMMEIKAHLASKTCNLMQETWDQMSNSPLMELI